MSHLQRFLLETRQAILDCQGASDTAPPELLVRGAALAMDSFLSHQPLAGEGHANAGTWTGKLLYTDEVTGFIVVMMSWGPGALTPIHDHGTWGVFGVLDGRLQFTNFARVSGEHRPSDGRRAGEAGGTESPELVRSIGTFVAGIGDVSYIIPPDLEIHQIHNPTSEVVHSLHVYGFNIGF